MNLLMKSISVLLTVHNRCEKTLRALERLYAIERPEGCRLRVWMTNDGCTDGTDEQVRMRFPEVQILQGDGSLFWNRGMRMAWEAAAQESPDFYLWLNDDTFLFDKALVRLVACSAVHDHRVISIGTTCDSATHSIVTYGGKSRQGGYVMDRERAMPCRYMNGNIVLIPRAVFDQVGYNDAHYRHALGDYDYGLMAQEKGVEIWVAPGFLGCCDLHETVATWKNPAKPLAARWRAMWQPAGANPLEYFYYRRKHFGFMPACVTFVSNFVHLLFPQWWGHDTH